ncbi:hypothetical protein N9937_00305 [bacterium]|nr:hypothetical protein [bacterium]
MTKNVDLEALKQRCVSQMVVCEGIRLSMRNSQLSSFTPEDKILIEKYHQGRYDALKLVIGYIEEAKNEMPTL